MAGACKGASMLHWGLLAPVLYRMYTGCDIRMLNAWIDLTKCMPLTR